MKKPVVPHRSVLITGCSSGIGWVTAKRLKAEGWQVFATARKAEDLDRLRAEGLEAVELDIADSASTAAAVAYVLTQTNNRLGALVNNAGFGMPGAMEDLSRDAMRRQFEVNLFGLQELTNLLIPVFREQGGGRIVNISSVVGRVALPFMGIYSASKFALEAVSDVLRVELANEPISVSLVEPGPISTRFSTNCAEQGEQELSTECSRFGGAYRDYFKQRRDGGMSEDRFRLPPEAVTKRILHALESSRPRIRYRVTLPAYLGALCARVLPAAVLDRIITNAVKKRYS